MYRILLTLLVFVAACQGGADWKDYNFAPTLAKQKYVPGMEDLPLYSGFTPIADKSVSFDSANGRIIEASYYSTGAEVEKVQEYYDLTLPELGWKKKDGQIYERDGEILKVAVFTEGKKTLLKFTIEPV